MNKYKTIFFISLIFVIYPFAASFSQDGWWKEQKYKSDDTRQKYALCKRTFKDVAEGFNAQNISYINIYFDSQVYLNIISSDKGYYSSNQAELILTDFMDYFRIVNFVYKRSHRKNSYAFATGKYKYNRGNGTLDLDVSVSLKYKDEKWYIDQISIY